MQEPTQNSNSTSAAAGSVAGSDTCIMRRGHLLLPSYTNDEKGREEFWRMLTENRKSGSAVRVLPPGTKLSENDYYVCGKYSNLVCLKRGIREEAAEAGPNDAGSTNVPEEHDKEKRLQEMTDHLRSLLGIGPADSAVAATPKTVKPVPSCRSTPRTCKSVPEFRSTPKAVGPKFKSRAISNAARSKPSHSGFWSPSSIASARVPFTARTPQPPPFLPCFSDDDEETSSPSTARQSSESRPTPNHSSTAANGDQCRFNGQDVANSANGKPRFRSAIIRFE